MGQPHRINAPHTTHHIIVRGSNRRMIFDTEPDRRLFERMLLEAATHHRWQILAWCVMGNHAHMALTIPAANLSQGMQALLSRYARAYNRRYDRADHVFRSRFRSHVIRSDTYLISAIAYIHRNPIEAGLVRHARDWPHSSYHQLMGDIPAIPSLDTRLALGVLNPNPTYARPMLDRLIHRVGDHAPPAEPPERPTLTQIVTALGPSHGIPEAISRGHSQRAVAQALGLTPSAICRRLQSHGERTSLAS